MIELWNYIKSPKYICQLSFGITQFVQIFVVISICCFGLSVFNGSIIKALELGRKCINYDLSRLVFYTVIIIPFIEEILFRLLLKPRWENVLFFNSFLVVLGVYALWGEKFLIGSILICLGCIMIIIFISNKRILRKIQIKHIKNFRYVFYSSVLVFGFLHLSNFEFNFWIVLFSPILVLPQIIGGLALGYIRMHFGIMCSILFHALNNLIPFLPFIYNSL
jgi:hypothetical protein